MEWILIILLMGDGTSQSTSEYQTEHACLIAKDTVQKIDNHYHWIEAVCVKKDD